MNIGFKDPQLTQRVSKILFDLYKERIKLEKIAKMATDIQFRIYTTIRLKARPCFVKAVNLFS